jgi:hypothetical protein
VLKKLLFSVSVVLLPCYSYSESITPYYGNTDNVAGSGLTWSMDTVLPTPPGLDIDSVIYNYTIQKQLEDQVKVHVQNENATGTGYIFRETDDWKVGSLGGTEINKVVGVGGIHRSLWGEGSIEVEGNGAVTDPNVVYTYKVDPCYDPQFNPSCPGYVQPKPPEIFQVDLSSIYDATKDENVDLENKVDEDLISDADDELSEEELREKEEEEERDSKERLEKALAAADNSIMFAQALAQSQMLETLNLSTNMNTYYSTTIQGGVYNETVSLQDSQLPENRSGLRNGLAQQLLHEELIDMQYNR